MKMNEQQRKYLESLGMAADADAKTSKEFLATLADDQRKFFDSLADVKSKKKEEPEKKTEEPSGTVESGKEVPLQAPDVEAIKVQARKDEQKRQAHVRSVAEKLNLGDTWSDEMIEGDFSAEHVNHAAITQAAANNHPVDMGGAGSSISVGQDRQAVGIGEGIMDAMIMRSADQLLDFDDVTMLPIARQIRQPHEMAGRFRGKALFQMAEMFLQISGRDTTGMSRAAICQAVFINGPRVPVMGAAGFASTADFPLLLANAQGKRMLARYVTYPQQWQEFCGRGTAPDFKQQSLLKLGDYPSLPEVKESGEYTMVKLAESREVYLLSKRGSIFPLAWEMLVNDDMGAFGDLIAQQGAAAGRTNDVVAFGVLTANAAMSDSVVLFHADHANLAGAGAAPSVTTYNAMQAAMKKQKGVGDEAYIMAIPTVLIHPVCLDGTVAVLNQSMYDPADAKGKAANIWHNRLKSVSHPLLDANSATKWYAATDPNVQPAIIMAFLEGMNGPQLTQEGGFNTDTRKYKVSHVVAGKAADWRLTYQNPGA